MRGGGAGCLCLCGQLLRLAKFCDSSGQGDKLGHQRNGRQRRITGQVPGQGNQARGAA